MERVAPSYRGNRVSYTRGPVREWYVNGPLGLEQGFTVSHRLGGGGGPLTLSLAAGGLRPVLDRGSVAFTGARGASMLRYGGLVAADARGKRVVAWLSLSGRRLLIHVRDRGAVYPLRIDPLVQQGLKLVGTGAVGNAAQGGSVALSADGNTVLVGGPADNNGMGAVWVFIRSGSTWSQQGAKLVGTGAVGNAGQGGSQTLSTDGVAVSADGNTALVGGPRDDSGTGAVWVFTRSGSTWSQQGQKLVGTGASAVKLSGDGNTALIGTGSGALVFTRSGSTWSQQGAKLVGTGAVGDAGQGGSVALSADGNTALIGGPNDNDEMGAAWVFTRSGSTWTQQGSKLVGTGAVRSNGNTGLVYQGLSVALSGDGNTALIGGPWDTEQRGASWVFTRSGSTWSQQGSKLVGVDGGGNQGVSVALSADGNTALVGGPYDNYYMGAAWVFARSGSAWTQQGSKLIGADAVGYVMYIFQGESVALAADGNTAVIGGPGDNPEPYAGAQGAAWVFVEGASSFDSFAPTSGITGSEVKITGTLLSGATSVKFGSLPASFTTVSDTQITATVPDGAVAGPVSVTTSSGTVTSAQDFTPTLSITGFSPASGPPGTLVDIKGIGFTPGSRLKFNGTPATDVSYVSASEIKAAVPLSVTSGRITLTNTGAPAGTVQSQAGFTVTTPPPTIGSFSPASGTTGSTVRITGTSLARTSVVKFGSAQASFTVDSGTQITATVPDGASPGKLSVTNPAGSATSAESFTPTLSITGLSPWSGPVGTVVTVRGVGFTPGAAVKFNGTDAAAVRYLGSGEVQATVPVGATSGPVTLSNASAPVGTVRAARDYALTPPIAPTIGSFTPTAGITGTKVVVTGTYLSGASRITFNGLAASNFAVYSSTQLGVNVPDGASQGKISITTAAGTTTSVDGFKPTLSITGVAPASGPAGTVVDIRGVGFTPTSTVQFNLIPATMVTYVNETELRATAPAAAGTERITVTTAAGTVRSKSKYAQTP